jgi:hypothetical protein
MRGRPTLLLVLAVCFATFAALFALVTWLVLRNRAGWSDDEVSQAVAIAAGIGGVVGALFGQPLFGQWLSESRSPDPDALELESWRAAAADAARSGNGNRAAQWVYAGSVALSTADELRDEFERLRDEILLLDANSTEKERTVVADQVRALARREVLVNRLSECAGILRQAASEPADWLSSAVDRNAQQDANAVLAELANLAESILGWVGAREKAPTPTGIIEVEQAIRSAGDEASLAHAQVLAKDAFGRIEAYRLREGRARLGQLRDRVAQEYGLPHPPELTSEA